MNDDKQTVETINITPKWVDLYPVYAYWIDSGTSNHRNLVKEELLKLCKAADDPVKEETFQYVMSLLNRMLEETKKDIDIISKEAINDDDRLEVVKMIDAWEKACKTAKTLDEEIYMLGSTMQNEDV